MNKIVSELNLLMLIANEKRTEIVNRIINDLKQLKAKDNVLVYGDDSGLRNSWEEYCVYMQKTDEFLSYAFDTTIYNFAKDGLSKLPSPYKETLEYIGFINIMEDTQDHFGFSEEEAITEIIAQINEIAMNDESRNVSRYVNDDFEEE
ncbi:MAG TPA: hypothetical protein PLC27_03040 [Saprospiraceae bacterium]|nr:hypothetical protein [Saprospiraceae bacterium]MBK6666173.1 hypothetical protein [Saprospiraceae bacterium]MBK8825865.1 hypothetical protein [Saprospiraceae bacterium]MBK9582012.1 hypothetical protein [Saprospiraceae bacterium]HQV68021.1 hypothetical protein [Saprospiraceae bacterium]